MAHSNLLKGNPMPECIPRYCALTVKHILIECQCRSLTISMMLVYLYDLVTEHTVLTVYLGTGLQCVRESFVFSAAF